MKKKILYPLPNTEEDRGYISDFIIRGRIRGELGAIVMDQCKTVAREYVDMVVIPDWAR